MRHGGAELVFPLEFTFRVETNCVDRSDVWVAVVAKT